MKTNRFGRLITRAVLALVVLGCRLWHKDGAFVVFEPDKGLKGVIEFSPA